MSAILLIAAVIAVIVCIDLNKKVWKPARTYSEASALYDAEDYLAAYSVFKALGSYGDSAERAADCILMNARKLSGKEDVLIGTSASMPWFSLAEDKGAGIDREKGYVKFDKDKYTGGATLVIPDVFDDVLVRGIYDKCFFWVDSLTSVEIPASVEYIGERAFFACSALESLVIPDTVSFIGENAFASCISLRSIKLGSGIDRISQRAFKDDIKLTSIEIPEGVKTIEIRAFNGCSELKEITLPSTLTSVGNYAFTGCEKLEKVTFAGTRAALAAACTAEDAKIILECKSLVCKD